MKTYVKFLVTAFVLMASNQAHAVYGVQDAINDALTDDLKLVGEYVPRYSESPTIPMCIYRGSKVVVYSNYCIKKVVGAVSIRIHSVDKSKGSIEIYAEARDKDNINAVKRDHYSDYAFHLSTFDNGSFNFAGSLKEFQDYDDKLSKSPHAACMSTRALPKHCDVFHQADINIWGDPASAFWNQPTPNWYQLIHLMRTKVP